MSTIAVLGSALREAARVERTVIMRLDGSVPAVEIERLQAAVVLTDEAAKLLEDLAQHDRKIHDLLRTGGLIDFPAYSPILGDEIQNGSVVLLRAEVVMACADEIQVRISTGQPGTSRSIFHGWADRSAIVGIKRR